MSLGRLTELFASRPDAMPMLNDRSGKAALRIHARSLMSDEGLPIARYELIRPLKREHVHRDRLAESSWRPATRESFVTAWTAEAEEASRSLRRETVHLATGLLLPIWDKLPDDNVQVVRIAADDGRSLLGREIAAVHVNALGSRLAW
jgi:hypothetical protein